MYSAHSLVVRVRLTPEMQGYENTSASVGERPAVRLTLEMQGCENMFTA